MWLKLNGSEITTSDKYTISSSVGVNTIVLENGTTLPSVVVSLTIHNLKLADEGNYTCRGSGEATISMLAVQRGTTFPPSSITSQPTTTMLYSTVIGK